VTLSEQKVNFVKIQVFKRQVFVHLMTKQMEGAEQRTKGTCTYDFLNCEISTIRLSEEGMGMRSIGFANLHPEFTKYVLNQVLSTLCMVRGMKFVRKCGHIHTGIRFLVA
jgi:hypothetical protein